MSNQLPACFTVINLTLSEVCTHCEIRKPVYHLPKVCHTFAEQSLRYCLMKHLSTERGYVDLVHSTLFLNYKVVIKKKYINNYSAVCTIRGCYVWELTKH